MPETNRREFGLLLAAGTAATSVAGLRATVPRRSRRENHFATGENFAATSTSEEATNAALWALAEGGNAADAYMAAALTQTVVEPGLTSLGGAFGMTYFDAKSGETKSCIGKLGPAAKESYDFDRQSPIVRSGRAMPVPGFIGGVHVAHKEFGDLPWKKLFEPAIGHATEGAIISPMIVEAAKRRGVVYPEGRQLWAANGSFLKHGDKLVQMSLARVLTAAAKDGPAGFYEGEFARNYVKRAAADGGRISLEDFKQWKQLTAKHAGKQPEGNYRGYQVLGAGLITYALHLNETLDLRAAGSSRTNPDSLYKQIRIMEEVFTSAKEYKQDTHAKFVSIEHAKRRAEAVTNGPLRKVTIDAIFNTCFLAVRDQDGNCAWGTHSINTPTSFGAGIVVDGVYAAYAVNRDHVRGKGATASGISTNFALYRKGRPELIIGSPGFGFMHGPYQVGTGVVEWELPLPAAVTLPRFSLQDRNGASYYESHYDRKVLAMLKERNIPHRIGRYSTSTGLVGALLNQPKAVAVVQDGRRDGWAKAG